MSKEISIFNFKEKELLIMRQLIINNIEPTEENIIIEWCRLFKEDKNLLSGLETFQWMKKHINGWNVKICDQQLAKIRRKGEKILKDKCILIGYGAKLVNQPKDGLAVYNIFTQGQKYSGNFYKLCRRIGTLPKKNKIKNGGK